MNDKIKIINDLCEKNEYYKSKTKIVMRKQNEVLFSRGGNAPNKKNSTTLDMSCILPFKQIVIRPDGKLSLCNNDALGEFTLGDVTKNKLVNIWYSKEYNTIRKALLSFGRKGVTLCNNCDSLYHPSDY